MEGFTGVFLVTFLSAGRSLHSGKYRPDIDGTRAIAVSSVVLCHAFPHYLPGGFIGVDIFFVISGYLISSILINDLEHGTFSIWNFYNRRIRRIFPALIVVLLFVAIFGWYCLFRPEFMALGRHISASTVFSENFLLWSEVSYFDVSSQLKPTLHLWSLAIEEQFYIFWPILLYFAYRGKVNFLPVIAILASASFLVNLHDIHTNPTAAYYSPLGRSWELMIGSFLAFIQAHRSDLLERYRNSRSVVGSILIALALIIVRPQDNFPGFWALLPTVGAALLISGGDKAWVNRRLLSTAPMVWCGLISYPLYLWHWPLLSFVNIIWGKASPFMATLCVAAAIIAATLTFFFIERPFRGRVEGYSKTFGLAGVMVVTLGCGVLISTQIIPPRLKDFTAPTRNEWSFLQQKLPGIGHNVNSTGIYPLEPDRKNLVMFIGDSKVAQYAERIDKTIVANPNAPGAILAIGGGCIPIVSTKSDSISSSLCEQQRVFAYNMADEKRFGTIVIGGTWYSYFTTSGWKTYDAQGRLVALTSLEGKAAALQSLGNSIKALILSGKHVIVVLDSPDSPSLNPAGKAIRLNLWAKNFQPNQFITIDARQIRFNRELDAWAKSTGASVINPFDAVCSGNRCRVTTAAGLPLYNDDVHFNPDWAVDNADFIDSAILSQGGANAETAAGK